MWDCLSVFVGFLRFIGVLVFDDVFVVIVIVGFIGNILSCIVCDMFVKLSEREESVWKILFFGEFSSGEFKFGGFWILLG